MSAFLSTIHLSKCGSFPVDNAPPHVFTATTRFAIIFWRRGGALTTAVYPENSGWRHLVNITIRRQCNRYQGHPALCWSPCTACQSSCTAEVLLCIWYQSMEQSRGMQSMRRAAVTKYGRQGFGDRCRSSLSHLQPSDPHPSFHLGHKQAMLGPVDSVDHLKEDQLTLACYYSWAQAGGRDWCLLLCVFEAKSGRLTYN